MAYQFDLVVSQQTFDTLDLSGKDFLLAGHEALHIQHGAAIQADSELIGLVEFLNIF